MARGEDYGAWGRDDGGRWPPSPRPRTREEARADLDRRTWEEEIDRRHDWRGARGEAWPPSRRPHGRDEARADVDRRTEEEEIDRRHDWRGRPAGPPAEGRRLSREEARADVDRRTERERIDRRHAWRGGGTGWPPARRPHTREEARADLDWRTEAEDIDRRHDWRGRRGGPPVNYGGRAEREVPRRGFAGPDWVEGPDLRGGGRETAPVERPERQAEDRRWEEPYGGYGGYGADEYSGAYGGIGPGRTGTYPATTSGGVSGTGSLLGGAGNVSGWEETEDMGAATTSSWLERGERTRRWSREGPLVRDVMTRNPRSVAPDDTVVDAAKAMREEDAGIIPVVHDGRVIGVVTDRDLAMRVLAEGRDTGSRVSEVMSEDVHVCTPDDRLIDAVRVMGEESVRRLPVIDRDDRLRGLISMTDVAREAEMDYALQEALEALASRRSFWSRW